MDICFENFVNLRQHIRETEMRWEIVNGMITRDIEGLTEAEKTFLWMVRSNIEAEIEKRKKELQKIKEELEEGREEKVREMEAIVKLVRNSIDESRDSGVAPIGVFNSPFELSFDDE